MECFILPAAAHCVYHNLEGAGLDYLPKVGGYFLSGNLRQTVWRPIVSHAAFCTFRKKKKMNRKKRDVP